jgi:non-homologous end joining protein Ku
LFPWSCVTLALVELGDDGRAHRKEVPKEDIAKGVEIAPGKYIEVTKDEIDAAEPPPTR